MARIGVLGPSTLRGHGLGTADRGNSGTTRMGTLEMIWAVVQLWMLAQRMVRWVLPQFLIIQWLLQHIAADKTVIHADLEDTDIDANAGVQADAVDVGDDIPATPTPMNWTVRGGGLW